MWRAGWLAVTRAALITEDGSPCVLHWVSESTYRGDQTPQPSLANIRPPWHHPLSAETRPITAMKVSSHLNCQPLSGFLKSETFSDVRTWALVTCSDPAKPEQNDDEALLIQTSIIDQTHTRWSPRQLARDPQLTSLTVNIMNALTWAHVITTEDPMSANVWFLRLYPGLCDKTPGPGNAMSSCNRIK